MSTAEVAQALGVSYVTVLNYCDRKDDPLPVTERPQGLKTLRTFDSDLVRAWAKRHGIPFNR